MSDILEFVGLMIALFLVIATIALAFYGLEYWLVRRIGEQWRTQKRTVQFGPILAGGWSLRPRKKDSNGLSSGAIGIVDDQFVFKGLFGRLYDVVVPLEHIHGVSRQLVRQGPTPDKNVYRVQVDFEAPGGWQVYQFQSRKHQREFAETLSTCAHLPLLQIDEVLFFSSTVANATRLKQDIYGKWDSDFTDQLYVGPDRILFGWQNAILFDTITAITLYDRANVLDGVLGAFNPVSPQDMMRIDYAGSDGSAQVIGFQLPGARKWADRIADRSGAPLTVHAGRKKHKTLDTQHDPGGDIDG